MSLGKTVRKLLKIKEKLEPFNPEEFNNMVKDEFYLMLVSPSSKQSMQEKSDRARSEKGMETRELPKGALVYITGLQEGSLEGYCVGNVESATLEDGTDMTSLVSENKVYGNYLFVLESVDLSNPEHPVLRGTAADFNIVKPELGYLLDQKIAIELASVSNYKSPGILAYGGDVMRHICPEA